MSDWKQADMRTVSIPGSGDLPVIIYKGHDYTPVEYLPSELLHVEYSDGTRRLWKQVGANEWVEIKRGSREWDALKEREEAARKERESICPCCGHPYEDST